MTCLPIPAALAARALLLAAGLSLSLPLAARSDASASPAGTAAAAPIPWASLSDADRAALLEPVRERWERATPAQQQRYLERARFWASLTPEQKQQARRGMGRWLDADPETRARHLEAWKRRMQNERPGHDTRSDRFDAPRDPQQGRGG